MNGADDNASGVAAFLELAEALSSSPPARRPVYLAAFAGEELGLLGSTYFVSHAPFPRAQCLAMINLDTVGRPREGRLLVLGTGSAREFAELVSTSRVPGLTAVPVSASYGSSDQWPFAECGIPSVQLFTGPHDDYHHPTDDWERLDYDGLTRVTEFARRLVTSLADREEPLSFESPAAAVTSPGPATGERAYLGTIPDFAYEGAGLRLAGTSSGGPAEAAGIAAGDILIRLGGDAVENLMDLTAALRAHRAGEEVEIVVRRGDEELVFHVTLTARP